ncbi:MAG: hypothetical protein EOP56_07140 [Sphingobacteriales bacterium]|nr:MAG: hypothetical protein EOP56_07140 [Sphingobacteriales bacterium]
MHKGLLNPYLLIFTLLLFASCAKEELPIELPPEGDASIGVVNLGSDYRDQIFYSFEEARIVMTSPLNSWDISFDASPKGYYLLMNGGEEGVVYNTKQTDMKAVTTPPKIKHDQWDIDDPSGLGDSSAVGEWRDANGISKGEVYVLKFNASFIKDTFKKIKLIAVDESSYTMEYGNLRSTETKTIRIPKEHGFNFAYFSFSNGGTVVMPEPKKDVWDIVFTRYRYIYRNLNNFPYTVTGVLLNPSKAVAYDDSTSGFDNIKAEHINENKFTPARDVIGFDWKDYNVDQGKYTVNAKKSYLIKLDGKHYWKLHFLNYFGATGEPGTPSFEFKRLK